MPKAITIAILAMGGEGGGVLADWLIDVAEHAGYLAQATSVPGVAQRTGATIYYLELFPEGSARSAQNAPVLALMPVPGEVDVVVASELMEAARAIQRGLVTSDRTALIASTHRVFSMTEKTAAGDGRVDSTKLIAAGRAAARVFIHEDFARIANDNGSVISAALFGALASADVLPFRREQFEDAIRRGEIGVTPSLAAFDAGFRAAKQNAEPGQAQSMAEDRPGPKLLKLANRVETEFPGPCQPVLFAAVKRLFEFQDERYADEYLNLLKPIREAEEKHGAEAFQLLSETARHLALWMTYEDAIRVADLKLRRARFERVRRNTRATGAQLVRIHEFLYPRTEEIADVLPESLGRWLLRSGWAQGLVERLTKGGKILETSSLSGFLQLYFVASLRRWRRKSFRFAHEHKGIALWLAEITNAAPQNYEFALELAQLPSLLKGYGDTRMRGQRSYDLLLAEVPKLQSTSNAALRLRELRNAALADDTGKQLEAELSRLTA
jgi:indolepyruvate ferredoxin oxidoreductase beta subunit